MKKNRSVKPHDKFFRMLMEAKTNATEIIKTGVPAKIVNKLNLNSLKKVDATFTDGKGGNFLADVIYECEYGDGTTVTITLLFEHKSYKHKDIFLQLLRYMLGVWEREKKNRMKLRPIIPIVFYHGQTKWNYRPFEEYFEGGKVDPDLLPFTPTFDFIFYNLQQKGDQWISENIAEIGLKIALLLMRNIQSPELSERIEYIFDNWEVLEKTEEGRSQFKEIWLYLVFGLEFPNEKIQEVMDRITFMNLPIPEGSAAWQMMQISKKKAETEGIEKGIKKGIKKGIEKGIEKGKAEVAVSLLKSGFDVDRVVELTGLTKTTVENLQSELF